METLVFKIVPWSNLKVWRTIELVSSQNLFDLHLAIISTFLYESDHLHAFYLNGHLRDRLFAYGDSSSDHSSSATNFRELEPPLNKRWLYVYDFGAEHVHDVQLVARGELEPGGGYPRVLGGEGDLHAELVEPSPVSSEAAAELAALLPELRSVVERHGENMDAEGMGQPREACAVQKEYALGRKLIELCDSDNFKIHLHVEHALEMHVGDWLHDLPEALGDVELYSLAVEMTESLLPLGDVRILLSKLPFWMLGKGDRTAARARIESNLVQYPQDYEILCCAGLDLLALREMKTAEKCLREGVAWAGTDWEAREDLAAGLMELLQEQGREQEIDQLVENEAILEKKARAATSLTGGPRLKPRGKKVGRNDPCPCSSGKKYKKCCGQAA